MTAATRPLCVFAVFLGISVLAGTHRRPLSVLYWARRPRPRSRQRHRSLINFTHCSGANVGFRTEPNNHCSVDDTFTVRGHPGTVPTHALSLGAMLRPHHAHARHTHPYYHPQRLHHPFFYFYFHYTEYYHHHPQQRLQCSSSESPVPNANHMRMRARPHHRHASNEPDAEARRAVLGAGGGGGGVWGGAGGGRDVAWGEVSADWALSGSRAPDAFDTG
ncbi:hypothetical protein FA13DRAFT_1864414 [Coprinellus micaceus]|uniref:Uncharacterized protein n=1 Tax=Coprinellus micaceus TaxID=71717 RepID=A0A4Y7SA14_COPMI|nr:hypothetical protein FA13DRAFT_1864414 [Coprinellus micaceus]